MPDSGQLEAWLIVIEAIATAVMTAVGTWWLRGTMNTWRGGKPLSSRPFFRVQPAQRKRHIDRCSLTVAAAELSASPALCSGRRES